MKNIILVLALLVIGACSKGNSETHAIEKKPEFKVICLYGFAYIKGPNGMLAPKYVANEDMVLIEMCHDEEE